MLLILLKFAIYISVFGLLIFMVSKEDAKRQIKKLIENFEEKIDYYSKTDEGNVETKLLEPLFYALGWTSADFEKREIKY